MDPEYLSSEKHISYLKKHQKYVSIVSFLSLAARALYKNDKQAKEEYLTRMIDSWIDRDRDFYKELYLELFEGVEVYLETGKLMATKAELVMKSMAESMQAFVEENRDNFVPIDFEMEMELDRQLDKKMALSKNL